MQTMTSNKPPQRALPWIGLVLLTVAAALALLWFFRPAPPAPARRAAVKAAVAQGSYHNRSLLPRARQGAGEPDKPTIAGNVYSSEGQLLPGATVVATTFDLAGNVPSPIASAKSDAEGRFAIPLARGTYQLTASLSGYGTTAALAESGNTVSLVLYKSGVIQGHVKDDHGRPVQHFTVDLVFNAPGDGPAPPPAWSKVFDSPDGAYRVDEVPIWPVLVRAVADEKAPGISAPLTVPPGTTRDVDLTVGEGCTLTGTVVDKSGAPLTRVLVNAEERITAGSISDPSLQTATQAQSGDDGTFSLDHVPQGTVFVRGYDGDYAVSTLTVQVGDCAKLSPVKLTMSTGATITGTARQADGKPIGGALVSMNGRSIGYVDTTSDSEGRFRFEAIPAGDLRLEMEHHGQRAVLGTRVKDGETKSVDLTLFAGGTGEIKGRVTAGGKPIASARLLIASNHADQGLGMYFLTTGEDGSYRLPSLPEGQYLVTTLGARASSGTQVNADQASTVNLDVGVKEAGPQRQPISRRMPSQPQPSPDAPTPSP
jgi:hypothetical protein